MNYHAHDRWDEVLTVFSGFGKTVIDDNEKM